MTEFEKDLNKRMDSKEVPLYFTQCGGSIRETYIETNWLLDTYKDWRSDEHVQKLLELGGSYLLANQNLVHENKRLTQEMLADLKSELDQRELLVVPECVAEWYEENKDNLEVAIYNVCVDSDEREPFSYTEEFEIWFDNLDNNPIETLILMKNGYQVEKLFYLKNKLTGMYLYKKPFGGYGEEATESIKDLTDDFKFTQKEIDEMDVQGYEKEDEYEGE